MELRQRARERVGEFFAQRDEKSRALVEKLMALPCYRAAGTVGLFAPLPSEPAIEAVWGAGPRRFCYPRVQGKTLVYSQVGTPAEVDQTSWNLAVREPAAEPARVVPLAAIDLLLVPGLAFTRDGHRLGRGGGYYDRLLAGRTGATFVLGICFQVQIVAEIPHEPHDERVDAVLTEEGYFLRGESA